MFDQRKRISVGTYSVAFRIFFFFIYSTLEPDLQTGSGQNFPAPTGFATLVFK